MLFSLEKFWHRLARRTYKPDFLFSNFGFGVLHSQKHYVMFQCIKCFLTQTEVGIRFQKPSLIRSLYFLILTVYLSYVDQVLLPKAVMPFLYWKKAELKKHFKKAHCEFYEQFSRRERMLFIQSL